MVKKLLVVLFFVLLALPVKALTFPSPTGYVNDFAGVLDGAVKTQLEEQLSDLNKQTGNQIAVVTVNSLDGEPIDNYANKLFVDWGVGGREKDTGILFLVAVNDRQMRIDVGYGLEDKLTDLESRDILDQVVAPEFKKGNYTNGIAAGTMAIVTAISGGYQPVEPEKPFKVTSNVVTFFILFGYVIFAWLARLLAPTKSWWLGGVFGLIFGLIFYFLFLSWVVIPVLVLIGLAFDYIVSKNYPKKVGNRIWPGGFWWGGFGGGSGLGGGSSGGFGGFGGGSSGGGGSSSSW